MKEQEDVIFINDVQVTAYERGPLDVFIPMEPLCKAIGLDYEAALERTKRHPIFKKELVAFRNGEGTEDSAICLCIPLEYYMGWLFCMTDEGAIGSKDVMLMCYDALYDKYLRPYQRQH